MFLFSTRPDYQMACWWVMVLDSHILMAQMVASGAEGDSVQNVLTRARTMYFVWSTLITRCERLNTQVTSELYRLAEPEI